MNRDIETAWAAGFFEGEGCIVAHQQSRGNGEWRVVQLQVVTTDLDVLERFQAWAGAGNIISEKRREPTHKDRWRWNLGRKDEVARILLEMLPHLGTRRSAKVQEAFDFHLGRPRRKPINRTLGS